MSTMIQGRKPRFRVKGGGRLTVCLLALLFSSGAMAQGQTRYANRLESVKGEQPAWVGPTAQRYTRLSALGHLPPELNETIALRLTDVRLEEALRRIAAEADLKLIYGREALAVSGTVTLDRERISVGEAFREVLRGTGLGLVLSSSGQLIVVERPEMRIAPAVPDAALDVEKLPVRLPARVKPARLQTGTIAGTVTDSTTGESLPGVNVVIAGTRRGAATDAAGRFVISELEAGTFDLLASFVGYAMKRIEGITVTADDTTVVNIALRRAQVGLEEVVVIGYGTQQEEDVTSAISSVSGEAFEDVPVTDMTDALEGRAAGVQIVSSGGGPASDPAIRIRGTGTINDASPLIVIDGIPTDVGSINAVDPDIIESVSILKDASAAAIYGNRAANGVILITTKRGRFNQDLTVSVSSSVGMSSPVKTIDVLEASEVAMLKRERYTNDGVPVNPIWQVDSLQQQRTNWQKALFGTGYFQDHNISIRGGSERSAYFVSGSYTNEQGMIEKSYFERFGLKINSDHRIGDVLRVKQNLLLSRTRQNGYGTLSAQSGLIWSAIRFHPGLPIRWPEGSYSSSLISDEFGDINNPLYTVDITDKNTKTTRLLGSVVGELELLSGLTLKADVGVDYQASNYYDFDVVIADQIRARSRNQLTRSYSEFYSILTELSLNYETMLADHHEITALGGYSVQTFDVGDFSAERMDFTNEASNQRVLSSGQTISGAGGGRTENALQSLFGRVNYAFKNKYLLTLSLRADGSSKFAEGNRWGIFPAVSAGWRISDESFFEGLSPVFSSLMLTAGWGQSGNQSVPGLQYLGLFGQGARYSFGGRQIVGTSLTRIPNPNITWEVAEMLNVGLDMGFFEDRLQAAVAYFIKDTEDMLLAPPQVGTFGTVTIPDINVGAVRNQGLEIELGYGHAFGDVSLDVYGNASFIRNTVLDINAEFLASRTYGRPNQELARTFEGHPIATFYGWRTDGLYQSQEEIDTDPNVAKDPRRGDLQPGDVRFVDLNGDGLIDGQDRTIIGNPNPGVTYGFGVTAGYRNLSLSLSFIGVAGVDLFNADRMQGLDPTYPFNMYEEALNRWHGPGTSNTVPRMTTRRTNLNHRASDLWIEPGDFLKLKTLTLGYALPQRFVGPLGLQQARLYVTGKNVFTLTPYSGLDPELGYTDGNLQRNVDYAQYPQVRTWTIGIDITI